MKRITALPVAVLAVAIAFGASACGDDGPTPTAESTTSPGTAPGTTEPTESTEPPATTVPDVSLPTEEPTEESATDIVVGVSESEAAAAAEEHGWILRVTRQDGEDLPATMDFRPNRVNVEVTDGVVTTVLNIG